MHEPTAPAVNKKSSAEVTDVLALDCEMVGAGRGGYIDLLARVSVVNKHGQVLYDTFVKPRNNVQITDYRTEFSGVRPENLERGAVSFKGAQKAVSKLIRGRVLVGHDLEHDFRVLHLSHPRRNTRDTALYPPFQKFAKNGFKFRIPKPSLRILSQKILNREIQQGEHDSVEDAKAAMSLYLMREMEWEKTLSKYNSKTSRKRNRGKHHPAEEVLKPKPVTEVAMNSSIEETLVQLAAHLVCGPFKDAAGLEIKSLEEIENLAFMAELTSVVNFIPPKEEMSATSEVEMSATSETEISSTSEVEMSATSEAELSATPDAEMSATPEAEMSATPEAEMFSTSEVEMSATPAVEMSAANAAKMSSLHECETSLPSRAVPKFTDSSPVSRDDDFVDSGTFASALAGDFDSLVKA